MKEKTAKQLLEKVKNVYSNIAEEFSNTRYKVWPELEFFKKYIKTGQTIIDAGCGNGILYKLIKEFKDINYIGIDNNLELLNFAQKNYSSAKFVLGDLIDFSSTYQADLIFSVRAFHHLPSNGLRKKSVQNFNKNLKKDGILILTVWNLFQKRYIKHIFKSVCNFFIQFGKHEWNDIFVPFGKTKHMRYYHAFTPKELKRLFKNNGFEILEMFYTQKGKKVPFLKSHNICLVCRKK